MTTQEALSVPPDQRMAQAELARQAKAEEITISQQKKLCKLNQHNCAHYERLLGHGSADKLSDFFKCHDQKIRTRKVILRNSNATHVGCCLQSICNLISQVVYYVVHSIFVRFVIRKFRNDTIFAMRDLISPGHQSMEF